MSDLVGNSQESLGFLRHYRPEGPWVLTSISPEQRGISSETFDPSTEEALRKWVDERQGKDNIYFTVNPLLRPMSGMGAKAAKTDVRGLAWLHVDVDPRPGEELNAERERALRIIRAYDPPPTVIIDSGGGYQGFWKLTEEQPTNGSEEKAIQLEAYNLEIALTLTSAGVTHNIDRIMRLPGTINVPNAKKKKAGRVPALASVVEADWEISYPISAFSPAKTPTRIRSKQELLPAISVDLDSLPSSVTDRTKAMIVHGKDPEAPSRYVSDSEAVMAVCCDLVRAGVADEIIAGTILHAQFKISEHVLRQAQPRRYAQRQVSRAHGFVQSRKPDLGRTAYAKARDGLLQLGISAQHNVLTCRIELLGANGWQEVHDAAIAGLRQRILDELGFDPGKEAVGDAIFQLCHENPTDPLLNYLDSLNWDGHQRVDTFLSRLFGAEDTPLNQAIGRTFLVAAVTRARRPGAKFDSILILEGEQGSGKSSAIRILAGDEYFSDTRLVDRQVREQQELISGVWLYEIPELVGMREADIEQVKAFASQTHDRGRPAYGRFRVSQPRRCVFVGTTNRTTYLKDATGNRRFWPVSTGKKIDLDGLKAERDQLWAEALEIAKSDPPLHLPFELWGEAAKATDARMPEDPWAIYLEDLDGQVEGSEERVFTRQLLSKIQLGTRVRNSDMARLKAVMLKAGWEGPITLRIGGEVGKGYRRPYSAVASDNLEPPF